MIQSISISLFFIQIEYNKYIQKIVCFSGPLIFGVYLIHNNNLMRRNILKYSFIKDPINISLNSAIILILTKALKMLIFCVIIDYFRNLIFILLRIRKICIILESTIRKI